MIIVKGTVHVFSVQVKNKPRERCTLCVYSRIISMDVDKYQSEIFKIYM